ncbi:hypothetical protein ACFSTE_19125 [Aquimarina hainanensis]|uniref:Uncharacterized protein n=1 Tax=Aquimarina hainanensis TaxID=1578017 RepID=A0ABW5NFI5_9FLAO|nr:hypothetical protein [Aquimarina sp. TRL1]QKX06562.1 hypothetical protein HN014_17125 [Aquimarina sp. TRL1]
MINKKINQFFIELIKIKESHSFYFATKEQNYTFDPRNYKKQMLSSLSISEFNIATKVATTATTGCSIHTFGITTSTIITTITP